MSEAVPEVTGAVRTFGRFVLRHDIGRGGMAAVYLAEVSSPEGFRKWVAVKAIHPHVARDPVFVRMFLDEARVAAQINHPNVCTVFDFGEAEGTYYLAMEYLHGESFGALMRRAWKGAGLSVDVAARVVADAARGLHAAHELTGDDGQNAGLVHRDVSPDNVFVLYDGIAKVVDFGIARSALSVVEDTRKGYLKGKYAYVAPEQVRRDGPVDRRADVFSLGVVLWEATVGQRLFLRDAAADTLEAVLREPVPPPSTLRPGYPPALDAVVLRALDRDPAARFATAEDLARALDAYLASTGSACGPSQVADLMREHFADRIAARNALLRQRGVDPLAWHGPASGEQRVSHTPAGIDAADDAIPVTDEPLAGEAPIVAVVPRATSAAPPSVARGRLIALGAAALLGPGALVLVMMAVLHGGAVPVRQPAHAGVARAAAPRGAPAPVALPVAPPVAPPAVPVAAPVVEPPRATVAVAPVAVPDAPDRRHRRHPDEPEPVPVAPVQVSDPGFLNLVAIPSARVVEGGTSLGFTPIAHRALAAGRHVLRLEPVDGSPGRTVTVTIRPNETEVVSVRLP